MLNSAVCNVFGDLFTDQGCVNGIKLPLNWDIQDRGREVLSKVLFCMC